jgi:hypothetical protein
MLPWINEQLQETKQSIHLWRMSRNVNVLAEVDHVELASTHTILGLHIGWENKSKEPITVMEIQVMVYKRRDDEVMLRLLPLERFKRRDIQRTLDKTALSQFTIQPGEVHAENIRFLSHGETDVPVGTYTTDVLITDTDHNHYSRRIKLNVETRMKFRLEEDWRHVTA